MGWVKCFLDAKASPSTYPCRQWVIDSFRFGDSYRISELYGNFSVIFGRLYGESLVI